MDEDLKPAADAVWGLLKAATKGEHMTVFNDQKQGDFVELEMRIATAQRAILQRMFMSNEETKRALEAGLERAIRTVDIPHLVAKEAEKAILEAIGAYFAYGEGNKIIREATNKALNDALPQLFRKPE